MLKRIDDFFSYLAVDDRDREIGIRMAERYGEKAQGMTDTHDYHALAAIALHYKPRRLFEIGTYRGLTSDFFLSILSESEVVSIAYRNPRWKFFGRLFNNSELMKEQIGSEVVAERRPRFTQLYGNSHELDSESLLKEYGPFDLVLIDGDHSAEGVSLDTQLAKKIIAESGAICWHDANPKPKYMDVRRFLEEDLSLPAIATKDDYVGGIAVWSKEIADRLSNHPISQRGASAGV